MSAPLLASFRITKDDPNLGQYGCDNLCQDYFLRGFAETYDEALAVIAYTESGVNNYKIQAHNILDYFAKMGNVPYKSNEEYVVQTGDVVWLGMAAAQYAKKYGSDSTTDKIFSMVDTYLQSVQSSNGGFLGGPTFTWMSTEHNEDALAYLTMRYQMTHSQDIDQMRQGVARWALQAYHDNGQQYLPRGQNDSVFSTDVQSSGVLSLLGVKQMDSAFYQTSGLGAINLGGLIQSADQTTLATVNYAPDRNRPSQTKSITGYRFSQSAPVSAEWSLQMALAKNAMGDTQGAARIESSIVQARRPNGGGYTSVLPYALSDGNTFPTASGGWTASTFPALSSTSWEVFYLLHFNPFALGG